MADLFHDTLNHLKDSSIDTDIDITDFLKNLPYAKATTMDGTISIFKTFENLKSKHLVIPLFTLINGQNIHTDKSGQDYVIQNTRLTFDDFKAIVNITSDGKNYLKQIERDKNQDSLTDSVRITNKWVKRTSILSVVIAAITLAYIIKDFYKTEKEVLTLPLQDQARKSLQQLDSIAKYQRQTEATLRKIQEGLPVKP